MTSVKHRIFCTLRPLIMMQQWVSLCMKNITTTKVPAIGELIDFAWVESATFPSEYHDVNHSVVQRKVIYKACILSYAMAIDAIARRSGRFRNAFDKDKLDRIWLIDQSADRMLCAIFSSRPALLWRRKCLVDLRCYITKLRRVN